MNTRKTLALFLVLCALCGGYYTLHWYDTHRVVEVAAAKRLFNYDADALASLRIERSDGTVVEAARKDGTWHIAKPYDHIVPNLNVWGRLSGAWATLSNERTFGDRDRATYGLDEPVLTVTGVPNNGAPTTIIFGATEPLQVGRYAYTEGVGVFLVKEAAFRELDRPLDDLRERHLVQVGEQGVTQLAFSFLREAEQGGPPLEPGFKPVEASTTMLVDKTSGTWTLKQPIEAPADNDAIDQLAKGLQFATAKGCVDAPESYEDYGLDPPRAQVSVWSEVVDGPQVIYLGDADASTTTGAIWAKKQGNPSVFQVGGELLTLLPTDPDSFRERRLLTRGLDGLEELELIYNGGAIRLVNNPDTAWQMVEPLNEDTDQTQVSAYLAILKNATGSTFPDIAAGEAGLIVPVYTIRLKYADETREIRIGAQAAKDPLPAHYVQLDFGAISILSDVLRNALVREPFDFRNKRLMAFLPDKVQRLKLTLDGKEYVVEKQLRQWRVTAPQAAVLESQSDIVALLKALVDARATAVEVPAGEIAAAGMAAFGLQEPVFRVELTVLDDDGKEQLIGPLRIGGVSEQNGQERFVQAEGRPEVFRTKQALLDAVREAMRGVRVPVAPGG